MIKANIYDKKLVVEDFTVSDSVKFDTVKFTFPNNWNGYTKTAVFKTEDGETFNVILDEKNSLCISENECYIPHEVIKLPYFYLSVFGVLGESIATTTQVKIPVLQSGYAEGEEPNEPTPTEYQQLINLANETKDIAESVRNDADNGLFKGDKGEQGIQGPKGEKGDTGDVSLEYANNTFASAIRCNAKGVSVAVNDVSPIEHNLEVKVSSKNLLPNNFYKKENIITDSYSVIFNEDGTITLNGDFTNIFAISLEVPKLDNFKIGESYILSGGTDDIPINFGYQEGTASPTTISQNTPFVWGNDAKILGISLYCPNSTVDNVTIKPQLECGTTATAYTPNIADFSNVKVGRYGKNLIPYPYYNGSGISANGVIFTVNPDRSITASGTPTAHTQIVVYRGEPLCKSGKFACYLQEITAMKNLTLSFFLRKDNANVKVFSKTNNSVLYADLDDCPDADEWQITVSRGSTGNTVGGTFFPVLEVGEKAVGYSDYIEPQTSFVNAEGTVEGIASISPNMTLVSQTRGINIDLTYNADTKMYIDNKILNMLI